MALLVRTIPLDGLFSLSVICPEAAPGTANPFPGEYSEPAALVFLLGSSLPLSHGRLEQVLLSRRGLHVSLSKPP